MDAIVIRPVQAASPYSFKPGGGRQRLGSIHFKGKTDPIVDTIPLSCDDGGHICSPSGET
jgi:hypothetical protein